jgi:NAD(P)H-hydrate epimerase
MRYDGGVRVVTAELIRDLDRRAINEIGIPGTVLMENAGRAAADAVVSRFGPASGRSFWIACGTGNNGGDGFAVARLLKLAGADVFVQVAGDPERIRGDARIHYDVMRRIGLSVSAAPPKASDVKIDALLGTGIQGAPREEIASVIEALNDSPGPTVAVDIPSGVDSDTGRAPGAAVRAELTVTFGYPKLGHFLAPGADLAGELVVSPIGFPWDLLECATPYAWIRPDLLRPLLPARPREAHKGLYGHLLVIGGSRGMSGAPTMAARAALRTGVGLVTVAAPAAAQPVIASRIDEAMTVALPETGGALAESAAEEALELAGRMDAVCLGPGMTRMPGAAAAVRALLRRIEKPVVLDADGLNALAEQPDSIAGRSAPTILTPHPGECARLLQTDTAAIQADRVGSARDAAKRYASIVVLKGARTLVCDGRRPDLPVSINTTGSPGMATGGSGDTLTGIIGAFAARGMDPFDAACLGVYLHGSAGDIAAARIGQDGLTAGDIGESVPAAIERLRHGL